MRAATAVLLPTVLLALVGAGCSDDDGRPSTTVAPTTSPTPDGQTSLYELAVGDCLVGLGQGRDVAVRLVPCGRRHEAEVYGLTELSADRFPGVEVLRRRAATACAPRFAAYTGEPSGPGTEVAFVEVVPTVESWAAGDRGAVCLALGLDGARPTGSIAAGGDG